MVFLAGRGDVNRSEVLGLCLTLPLCGNAFLLRLCKCVIGQLKREVGGIRSLSAISFSSYFLIGTHLRVRYFLFFSLLLEKKFKIFLNFVENNTSVFEMWTNIREYEKNVFLQGTFFGTPIDFVEFNHI